MTRPLSYSPAAVRQAIWDAHMSQAEVARHARISPSVLSEGIGERVTRRLSREALKRIAHVLGLEAGAFDLPRNGDEPLPQATRQGPVPHP